MAEWLSSRAAVSTNSFARVEPFLRLAVSSCTLHSDCTRLRLGVIFIPGIQSGLRGAVGLCAVVQKIFHVGI